MNLEVNAGSAETLNSPSHARNPVSKAFTSQNRMVLFHAK
jgi:hypothetical protein